jgi:glycosyltransferase involved in cell wall biosynthesis
MLSEPTLDPTQATDARRRTVSVIAPVYNEEAVIEQFVARVAVVADSLASKYDVEIVLVDDGSRDRSLEKMKALTRAEPRLRVVELRRNYGQTAALQAGLDAGRGEILVTMDSDLQHFPEEIPTFLAKLDEGYDVVCGWRHQRQEGAIRRWPSRAANKIIRRLSGISIHDFGTTFRAYRADAVKDLRLFGEFHRYVPVLAHMQGARLTELPIQNIERPAGKSSYGIGRTFGVMLDLCVLHFMNKYMDRPMRAFGTLAFIGFAVSAAIMGGLFAYAWIYNVQAVKERVGWFLTAIMIALASVQFLLTGLLAEILMRVHYAQGDRRVYGVRREWPARR